MQNQEPNQSSDIIYLEKMKGYSIKNPSHTKTFEESLKNAVKMTVSHYKVALKNLEMIENLAAREGWEVNRETGEISLKSA